MDKTLNVIWSVYLNGVLLDYTKKLNITNISIQEQCDGSDTCTLTIKDINFEFIEDNIFIEEAKISVYMGIYGDNYTVSFNGYISAIDITFPSDGTPELSIFCLDNSHIMNRVENNNTWDNTTRAEVIKQIAQSYGFNCIVEPNYNFKVEDTITQSNSTDISFCESLATEEREPFLSKLIGDTFYYVKKGTLQEAEATLYYKRFPYDIISFNPKINKETRQEEIVVSDINTTDKTVDTGVANSETTSRDTQGESVKTTESPNMYFNREDSTWEVQ